MTNRQPRQLTREILEAMDEATLRQEVLIPLFRAMEFNGVHEYHGSGERGKDIIMWNADKLGQRTNYAVIVVAERLSGNARGGKGSAAKVCFQVQQAFGSSYKDLSTLKEQRVDHCWIVTSKAVKADARESIAAALGTDLRTVRIVDGDELWALVEKYLSPQLLSGKLKDVHQILDSLSGKYSVNADIGGQHLTFKLIPRSPESTDCVVDFNFPDTLEGNEAKQVLEEHLRTGAPVEIPARFIGDTEIADLLHSVAGNEYAEIYSVVLGPRGAGYAILTDILLEHADGSCFMLPGITLTVANAGTEEIRFIGSRQGLPMLLDVTLRDQRVNMRMSQDIREVNVKQQFEIISFSAAMHLGGRFEFRNIETEMPLLTGDIPADVWPAPPALLARVAKELLEIQRTTGKLFSLPAEFSAEDAERVLEVSQIIRTGTLQLADIGLNVPLARDVAERMLNEFGRPNQSFYLRSREEKTTELFGQEIVLGRSEIILPQAYIPKPDRQRLLRELAAGKKKVVNVTIRAPKNSAAALRYDRWLNREEREKYPGIEATRSLDE